MNELVTFHNDMRTTVDQVRTRPDYKIPNKESNYFKHVRSLHLAGVETEELGGIHDINVGWGNIDKALEVSCSCLSQSHQHRVSSPQTMRPVVILWLHAYWGIVRRTCPEYVLMKTNTYLVKLSRC